MLTIVCIALQVYLLAVLAWIILSWIQVPSDHPIGRVQVYLDRIILPIVLPLRRVLPPLRLGNVAISLAGIVLLIGVQLLASLICR